VRSASSDGTTVRLRRQLRIELPTLETYQRSGRETHEFLVYHEIDGFRDGLGNMHAAARFHDPQAMVHGKTTAAQWDRCGIESLTKVFRCLHALLAPTYGEEDTAFTPEVSETTEWMLVSACCLHDTNKALEWALFFEFHDEVLLTDAWVGIESLRNSLDVLVSHMGLWVVEKRRYRAGWGSAEQHQWKRLWDALGVAPQTAQYLAETLQLRWEDGHLNVAESLAGQDTVGVITQVILSLWRFKGFTKSRWLTVGQAARCYLCAELTGVRDLVQHIQLDPRAKTWHLNGFARVKPAVLRLFGATALVSRPADALMSLLMEDSRVTRRVRDIKDCLVQEMRWLSELPHAVWSTLAKVCGYDSGGDFSEKCISAAHTSVGFIHFRILKTVESRPWSLCQGDIAANLAALKSEDEPHDDVTRKVWHCLQLGWPSFTDLVRGVDSWNDLEWDTKETEKQHANAATLMRFHPEYTLETMTSRSMTMQANKLLPRPTRDEKALAQVQAKIEKLRTRQVEKAGGRHLFVKELFESVESQVRLRGAQAMQGYNKRVIKVHGKAWAEQSTQARHHYNVRALAMQDRAYSNRILVQGLTCLTGWACQCVRQQ